VARWEYRELLARVGIESKGGEVGKHKQ